MKILILTPNLKRGGAERVLSELSLEWSKNHNITFSLFDKSEIANAASAISNRKERFCRDFAAVLLC